MFCLNPNHLLHEKTFLEFRRFIFLPFSGLGNLYASEKASAYFLYIFHFHSAEHDKRKRHVSFFEEQ